ncbi:uncharacterized protein [Macrobrachium rosenbergii]|uniref:uncharacterized protein n=1 Tax=Macrobrachium rosenbergii TaxID=79674 RepID=UPI0034D65606
MIKDDSANNLTEEVKRRWKDYFSQPLDTENECEELENVPPVEGPITNIRESEVENAIKKGKVNKAAGKSELTIEMIKALGNLDKEVLSCGNYRGIKLLQHVLKILERIVKGKLRELIDIHEKQFWFMKGKSTVDAICIVRQEHFVDLVKVYNRVPR